MRFSACRGDTYVAAIQSVSDEAMVWLGLPDQTTRASTGIGLDSERLERLKAGGVGNGIEAGLYRELLPILGQNKTNEIHNQRIGRLIRFLVQVQAKISRQRIVARIREFSRRLVAFSVMRGG